MVKCIKFDHFRGFKYLELPELSQITLFTGKNGAGKTSVLEGLFLLFDHVAADSFLKLNSLRGMPVFTNVNQVWEPMFYHMNTSIPVSVSAATEQEMFSLKYSRDDSTVPLHLRDPSQPVSILSTSDQDAYSLKYAFRGKTYTEDGYFFRNAGGVLERACSTNLENNLLLPMPNCLYINNSTAGVNNDAVLAEWYGKAELDGKKQSVLDALHMVESSLTDIKIIVRQGQIQLYADVGLQLLPLKLAGDGLNRLLYLILAIYENPGAVILLDEVTTGFHYSVLPRFWEEIAKATRENGCQLIATTHSYEGIQYAVDGIAEAEMRDVFCLYRLERTEEVNRAVYYSGELVESAVSADMEVR